MNEFHYLMNLLSLNLLLLKLLFIFYYYYNYSLIHLFEFIIGEHFLHFQSLIFYKFTKINLN